MLSHNLGLHPQAYLKDGVTLFRINSTKGNPALSQAFL